VVTIPKPAIFNSDADMSDIFQSTEVWCIVLPGLGRVFLQEHNQQPGRIVICRKCQGAIEPGTGCRFVQERNLGRMQPVTKGNGYLCRTCIKHGLQETARWQFNDTEASLFKANGYTLKPIEGQRLADLWMLNGTAGLMAGIREALEVPQVIMRKG